MGYYLLYLIWNNLATCNMLEAMTPEGWIIVDVRDLNDNGENDIEAIKRKIIVIANLMSCGQKICVRCLAGMSRSNTMACAGMMFFNYKTWDHNWKKIEKVCPRARANLEFTDLVKKALLEMGLDRKRIYYD